MVKSNLVGQKILILLQTETQEYKYLKVDVLISFTEWFESEKTSKFENSVV